MAGKQKEFEISSVSEAIKFIDSNDSQKQYLALAYLVRPDVLTQQGKINPVVFDTLVKKFEAVAKEKSAYEAQKGKFGMSQTESVSLYVFRVSGIPESIEFKDAMHKVASGAQKTNDKQRESVFSILCELYSDDSRLVDDLNLALRSIELGGKVASIMAHSSHKDKFSELLIRAFEDFGIDPNISENVALSAMAVLRPNAAYQDLIISKLKSKVGSDKFRRELVLRVEPSEKGAEALVGLLETEKSKAILDTVFLVMATEPNKYSKYAKDIAKFLDNSQYFDATVQLLGHMSGEGFDELISFYDQADKKLKLRIITLLNSPDNLLVRDFLERIIKDPEGEIREAALIKMAQLYDLGENYWIDLLKSDKDPYATKAALFVLMHSKSPSAIDAAVTYTISHPTLENYLISINGFMDVESSIRGTSSDMWKSAARLIPSGLAHSDPEVIKASLGLLSQAYGYILTGRDAIRKLLIQKIMDNNSEIALQSMSILFDDRLDSDSLGPHKDISDAIKDPLFVKKLTEHSTGSDDALSLVKSIALLSDGGFRGNVSQFRARLRSAPIREQLSDSIFRLTTDYLNEMDLMRKVPRKR